MPKGAKYGRWSTETMEKAIAAYRSGMIGLNEVCRQYDVPKHTLKRHLEGKNNFAVEGKKVLGSIGDLPPAVEQELVQHIQKLKESLFKITTRDFRQLAFQIAERNGIPNRFNKGKREAGKKWYYNFMRRHPEMSLAIRENTSIAKASCFSGIKDFFELLEQIVDKHHLSASNIFNMDEIELPTVQRKQVVTLAKRDRETMTTAVCCVSAAGFYLPPMLIYKRGKASEDCLEGAPPGTVFVFNSDSNYINKDIFLMWMQHFIKIVKATKEAPVLLLCDGHSTHIKNLDAMVLARENGVIMLALPSQTSNHLQSLDKAFFKPLSLYFTIEIEKFLCANPDRIVVTDNEVAGLFGGAYAKTATFATAINAFRRFGLWPVNIDVYKEHNFAPSIVFQTDASQDVDELLCSSKKHKMEAQMSNTGIKEEFPTIEQIDIKQEIYIKEEIEINEDI